MSNVLPFRRREAQQDRQRLAREHAEELQQRKRDTRGYLKEFKRRFQHAYVPLRDRIKIAHGIQLEIELLVADPRLQGKFTKSALVLNSGISSSEGNPTKRLREVTIRNDQLTDEKRSRCLSATALPYAQIIESIVKFSQDSEEGILDRIFSGTTIAGSEHEVADSRKMAGRLNDLLARVDKVFELQVGNGIASAYAESAHRKSLHQQSGGRCNWPFFDFDDSVDPNADADGDLANWRHPYWAPDHTRFGWRKATCLDWLSAIAFLPRHYLGCGFLEEDWLAPQERSDPARMAQVREQLLIECRLGQVSAGQWKPLAKPASAVLFMTNGGQLGRPNSLGTWLDHQGQMWVVIYPDPENRERVCPTLYWCCGEGGVHVTVLSWKNIERLAQVELVAPSSDEPVRLVDHLSALVKNRPDELFLSWTRTALDLLDNPFLSNTAGSATAAWPRLAIEEDTR